VTIELFCGPTVSNVFFLVFEPTKPSHMSSANITETGRLLGAAKEGHDECLGRLLQMYSSYLKILARTQIDRKLRARTSESDIVQDTLMEAHRDFVNFRGNRPDEFMAWLRKILINNLARIVERHVLAGKRDVRREISMNDVGASLQRSTARLANVLVDVGKSPSSGAQQHEAGLVLADELAALDEDYRDVIVLRHLEGLSFPEVAQRMERSPGAVRMLWMRAIAKLRERLHDRSVL
jgi:RNA polymerase sigma-70 factor, ECF subfamily